MFVVVLWLVFGVPRSSHVLLVLVVLTEREWVGLFRECSIFEREEWYPEFGLAYDELCWSQEWLSLVLGPSFSLQFSLKLCMFRSCESLWQVCPTCCTLGVHSFDIFNSLRFRQCLQTPTLRVAFFFCSHEIVKSFIFFAVLSLRDPSL